MSLSDYSDRCDPCTREYLHDALRSLPQDGSSVIKIVKQAMGERGDTVRALGVFPASFNPPTSAHQALVRKAEEALALDEILLILDQQAVGKERLGAPLEDRLLMLLVLFGADPQISVGISNRGLFLDKVDAVRTVYAVDTKIYFIVGYDTIVRVLDPQYYGDRNQSLSSLFSQARFVVANRGGCDERDLRRLFDREENLPFAERVMPLMLPPALAGISSSVVRRQLAEGKSIKGLVPPELEEFLLNRGFYRRHDP
jgi:nicotinic acid mononucleotide adenylyltransferase